MAVRLYHSILYRQQVGKGKARRYQKVNLGWGAARPISPVPIPAAAAGGFSAISHKSSVSASALFILFQQHCNMTPRAAGISKSSCFETQRLSDTSLLTPSSLP